MPAGGEKCQRCGWNERNPFTGRVPLEKAGREGADLRDPFLLLTDDGGKIWRKKPIYSETRVGAIEQFAFETSKDGGLLIDRTQNGDSGGRHF